MTKNTLSIQYIQMASTLELSVCGEIDHHNAQKLRQDADELIKTMTPKKLVLNLSKIDFMDSSGLGFIMGRMVVMQKLGGELIVKKPSKSAEKMCRLAGLERMVKIEK